MKLFLTGLCIGFLLMITGCTKDSNQFIASPFSDTAWVQQILPTSAIARLSDTLRIQPGSLQVNLPGTDTETLSGLQYILPYGGWQTPTGSTFQGEALLQGLLLQKPGDWVRNFITTSYQGKIIETSGVIYLNMTVGDESLQPAEQALLTFAVSDASQTDSLFYGGYTNNTLQWSGTLPNVYYFRGQSTVNGTAQLVQTFGTPKTGWLLSGMEMPDSIDRSGQLIVILPNSFSNANSAVFCFLKNLHALIPFSGDYPSRTFIGYRLPVGETAIIITLTFTGNGFYLGSQTVTIRSGSSALTIDPSLETLSSLVAYLQQL